MNLFSENRLTFLLIPLYLFRKTKQHRGSGADEYHAEPAGIEAWERQSPPNAIFRQEPVRGSAEKICTTPSVTEVALSDMD